MKITSDKWGTIKPYLAGKSVLDAGCCDQAGTLPNKRKGWLHEKILEVAGEVVGVDIHRLQVESLRLQGFTEIVWGDIESIQLGRQFDTVFAGELIEHLSNPGMFLDNMYCHLKADGHLIITTPNRFTAMPVIEALLYDRLPHYSKEYPGHVNYFDINSLTALANRHHFAVVGSYYIRGKLPTLKSRLVLGSLIKFRPLFSDNILVVLRKI